MADFDSDGIAMAVNDYKTDSSKYVQSVVVLTDYDSARIYHAHEPTKMPADVADPAEWTRDMYETMLFLGNVCMRDIDGERSLGGSGVGDVLCGREQLFHEVKITKKYDTYLEVTRYRMGDQQDVTNDPILGYTMYHVEDPGGLQYLCTSDKILAYDASQSKIIPVNGIGTMLLQRFIDGAKDKEGVDRLYLISMPRSFMFYFHKFRVDPDVPPLRTLRIKGKDNPQEGIGVFWLNLAGQEDTGRHPFGDTLLPYGIGNRNISKSGPLQPGERRPAYDTRPPREIPQGMDSTQGKRPRDADPSVLVLPPPDDLLLPVISPSIYDDDTDYDDDDFFVDDDAVSPDRQSVFTNDTDDEDDGGPPDLDGGRLSSPGSDPDPDPDLNDGGWPPLPRRPDAAPGGALPSPSAARPHLFFPTLEYTDDAKDGYSWK